MSEISRRGMLQAAVVSGVGLCAANSDARTATASAIRPSDDLADRCGWLDNTPAAGSKIGVTWGVPWPRGRLAKGQSVRVETADGTALASQAWPIAYWPDGSVKWTAVAAGPGGLGAGPVRVVPGTPAGPNVKITVADSSGGTTIDTGVIKCTLAASFGTHEIIQSVERAGRTTLVHGRLVAMRQDGPADATAVRRETFDTRLDPTQILEQAGPVRAVVKLTGKHTGDGREWLPFVVRLYFYAGSDVIRVVHSFVYDGDPAKDYLCGLGLRFDVPMRDKLHNRHVRFVGQDHGLFAEAVRPITGLRRDPGEAARRKQFEGQATSSDEWATSVSNRLGLIPAWGDFTLSQCSADGFQIRKRTAGDAAWIPAAAGGRAAGVGYVGGAGGGVSFGVRDFWQKHPAQLDVRNATTDTAAVTLWLYAPDAGPMDLRPYHGPEGFETYDRQTEGLNVTYEDYEPGYDTPYGVARTGELSLRIEAATPAAQNLVEFADAVRRPPQLMATPQRFLQCGVFGRQWTAVDESTPTKQWIERRLARTLDAYLREIDQRSWYGFWDYGDVMHSYDEDRHQWRYDVGGYAWDNSELSTDLWLWMSVLRTGRGDLFRMAEAMTRHTGEVDVYHLGRFKGLGTRHGVQHWSDSSKQSRISTPIYRRMFYYLTADERVGDLLRDQLQTIEAEKKIVVGRKLKPGSPTLPLPPVENGPPGGDVDLGGMGFGNAMAAWVTEAERTGDARWHAKIAEAMNGVAKLPLGFYTIGWTVNVDTGRVKHDGDRGIGLSHLQACFGLPEMSVELIDLYGDKAPAFAGVWADYGRLYSATDAERATAFGDAWKPGAFKGASLRDTHSRCTAYAAMRANDPKLARRAKDELLGNRFTPDAPQPTETKLVGPVVLNPIVETRPIGTNGAAQWGLAAMECLAFIGDQFE